MPKDAWAELIARGAVIPPSEPGDILDEPPREYDVDASGRLAAMRDYET